MNSRERVRRAVEFTNPDRIPLFHGVLPAAFEVHGKALEDLLLEFPDDVGWSRAPKPEEYPITYRTGEQTDEWGCVWHNDHAGMLGICVGHPLKDWSNWSSYKLPDLPSKEHWEQVQKNLEASHEYYSFGWGINIFERMQWLRGYEDLMFDIVTNSEEAFTLRDALVDYAVQAVKDCVWTDVDALHFSDDWGTQQALMISPASWRSFYKPAYKKMFEPAKAAGKHIHFHSDGVTWDILHDLAEVGVDVLNIQHTIMDIKAIAREFGGKTAFRSDLDRQHILLSGTRQEIRDHVKEVIDCLGSYGGGLIGHGEIGPDIPLENARYMFEAFAEFGGGRHGDTETR